MEILKTFGVDPILLGAQIINFLIIFYLLKRFLYKPVLGMLKKREDKIKEGMKQAEEARITLEKTLEEEKKIFAKAHDEAKALIVDAKMQALEVSKEIEDNTKRQAEKILLDARAQIEQDTKRMEIELGEKISVLAKEMLEKSLQGVIGEKEQQQIVAKAVKNIKNTN
ncbi:MAG TPA: F0F1 ATP synthase subunit B [Patescibacteria group bacterium]|jgi:F-type H+-transporting ATPase subunit b|nr:F0F1 ATP synthase subunit B [Patescibacteria group bacterium]